MSETEQTKLDRLQAMGYSLEAFSEEQLEALRELSEEEMALLIDIRQRILEHGPEAEAHTAMTIGGLFF